MRRLYTPSDESELVFLKSMFEASRMPYYVQNENFGSLYTGSFMGSLNAKTIMVPEDIFEDAKDLIRSVKEDAVFEDERGGGDKGGGDGGSLLDDVLEFLSLKLKRKGRERG